jgi:hypothetical protein
MAYRQSIPAQIAPEISREERMARAYRLTMLGGISVPHTEVTEFYASRGIWRDDGTPTSHVLLTAELNRRGLNR